MILKWTNKHSGETGYVKSIDNKERHFVATWEKEEAKTFAKESTAKAAITKLKSYGEADNNVFDVISE